MKIGLLGYGKMGKEIEKMASHRGHEITLKVNDSNDKIILDDVDVAIDFSLPSVAFKNISDCINNKTPIISGTTGWLDKYEEIVELCKCKGGTFLYASNFSLGVNIFFKINEVLATLMKNHNQYEASIEEIHHTQKLDAPSGTAITLAKQIIENTNYTNWTSNRPQPNELSIVSERINDVPGTHKIEYKSAVDTINIEHIAHNRSGFALGAVIAAEWIVDKKGIFTMKDVLNIA
ncbi:dihydrodipicolinate reductase [Flavobacteriaceae bacterium MAR_2010_188]|nr:dihydrodipicolinate reductase [Flavobacteriaceae bacterium MAR_2010_188]